MADLLVLYREALPVKKSNGTIDRLRDTLTSKLTLHEPWTSGIFAFSEPETTLFERKDGTSKQVAHLYYLS